MTLELALLAARRTLRPASIGLALLALALGSLGAQEPPPELASALEATGGPDASARALERQASWTLLLLLVVPVLVLAAARAPLRWRERDAAWLAPGGRARAIAGTFVGAWLASCALLACAAALCETLVGSGGEAHRIERTVNAPSIFLLDGDRPVSLELEERAIGGGGRLLRFGFAAAMGSGPAADVTVELQRAGAARPEVHEIVVFGRRDIVLPIPRGEGDVRVTLTRVGEGATLVLPRGALDILVPAGDGHRIGLELLLHACLASGAWIALALGLGAWVGPGTCTFFLLCAWLPAWTGAMRWLPGAELPRALDLAGRGLLPPAPGSAQIAALVALALVGFLLARAGLQPWRRNA